MRFDFYILEIFLKFIIIVIRPIFYEKLTIVFYKQTIARLPYSFFYCLATTAGIICSSHNVSLVLVGIFLLFLFSQIHTNEESFKKLLLYTLTFSSGFISHKIQIIHFANIETEICEKPATIIGTVIGIKTSETKLFKTTIELMLEQVNTSQKRKTVGKKIILNCFVRPPLKPYQRIKIKNIVLKKINDADFKNYLIRMQLFNSTFVNKLHYTVLDKSKRMLLDESLATLKDRIIKTLESKIPPQTFFLFESIFLGDKERFIQSEYSQAHNFNQWGIAHILARSGLHVSILLFLFRTIMNATYLPFLIQKAITLCFMLLFYALSTPATPFLRAFFMYLIHETCLFANLATNTLHIFCLATTGMLLFNPSQLFFLDFQLSFGITLLLLLWSYK